MLLYSVHDLCALFEVVMAETGWSRTHLSRLINGAPNTISRLLSNPGTTYAHSIETLSDWCDEHWPVHVPWPADVQQREPGRRLRDKRLDEAQSARARLIGRFDNRIRELIALHDELTGEDHCRLLDVANGQRAKIAKMGRVLGDLKTILDADEALPGGDPVDLPLSGKRRGKERAAAPAE